MPEIVKIPPIAFFTTLNVLEQLLKGKTLLPILALLVLMACAQPSLVSPFSTYVNASYTNRTPGIGGQLTVETRTVDRPYDCDTAEMPQLELTMFNVSQGQSVLLRIPKREGAILAGGSLNLDSAGILDTQYTNIVYDAGPKIKGKPLPDTIDQLIISNPDKDHLSGASWILDTKQVNKYIEPGILPCNTNTCAMVKQKALAEPGIQIVAAYTGDKIYEEDTPTLVRVNCRTNTSSWAEQKLVPHITATIEYLNPDPLEPLNNDNDNSIVLLVTYGDTTILLMGDCETKCENKLIERHYPQNVDILITGHHGSSTSSSAAFIEMVSPKIALISVGANNQYGHPGQEVIRRLEKKSFVYRTDESGDIKLRTDGTKINVFMNEVSATSISPS